MMRDGSNYTHTSFLLFPYQPETNEFSLSRTFLFFTEAQTCSDSAERGVLFFTWFQSAVLVTPASFTFLTWIWTSNWDQRGFEPPPTVSLEFSYWIQWYDVHQPKISMFSNSKNTFWIYSFNKCYS